MNLSVHRHYLQITPENKMEEAYIEEVLGLRNSGDVVHLVRDNASGSFCIVYLRTLTVEQEEMRKEPPA